MPRSGLRRLAARLRRTPLHPQWLLGGGDRATRALLGAARGRVLDIGSADRWAQSALGPGCTYIALDHPVTGRGLYGARPDCFGDAAALPLVDAAFDCVLLLDVLEHVRAPAAALSEAARVLRAQGRLLVSIPFLYPAHDEPHDYQRLTVHGLRRDLGAAGFRVHSIRPSLGTAESAGVLAALALGGMALSAVQARSWSILWVPLLVAAVPLVNLVAWMAGRVAPDWSAFTAGYVIDAERA